MISTDTCKVQPQRQSLPIPPDSGCGEAIETGDAAVVSKGGWDSTRRWHLCLHLAAEPRSGSLRRSAALDRLVSAPTHLESSRAQTFIPPAQVRLVPAEPFTLLPQSSYGASFERVNVLAASSSPADPWTPAAPVPAPMGVAAPLGPNVVRRCVYRYADKYGFARLVMEDSLVFDSHFECGNLEAAFGVGPPGSADYSAYELLLNPEADCGSGSVQWFCFIVRNAKPGRKVTFLIRNFSKPDSLFRTGMRPLIKPLTAHSNRDHSRDNCGWSRCGENISYLSNGPDFQLPVAAGGASPRVAAAASSGKKAGGAAPTYTLQFSHTFERGQEAVMFAYGFPYSYSDLQLLLAPMSKRHRGNVPRSMPSSFISQATVLCLTNAGNQCHLLTVTGRCESEEVLARRPVAIFTARVHPGETNASWMMHGLLEFFLGSSKEAAEVRNRFVIKLIPMLNPDGVINGNNRKSLTGFDLNRVWAAPDPALHPTIFHAKGAISKLAKARHVCLCVDLHGHSRKEGIFVYGCVPDRSHVMSSMQTLSESDQPATAAAPTRSSGVAFNHASLAPSRAEARDAVGPTGGGASNEGCVPRPPVAPQSSTQSRTVRPPPAYVPVAASAPAPSTEQSEADRSVDASGRGRSRTFSGGGGGGGGGRSPSPGPLLSGCDPAMDPYKLLDLLNWKVRLFPRIMQSLIWCYDPKSTWYRMEASKASTMRMVMFTELGIECSYTVEASLAGARGRHFGVEDLIRMGADLGRCLYVWKPLSSEANYKAAILQEQSDSLIESEVEKIAQSFASEVRSRCEELGGERAGSVFWRHVELSQILSPSALSDISPNRVSRKAGRGGDDTDGPDSEEDASDTEERAAGPAPSAPRRRNSSTVADRSRPLRPRARSNSEAPNDSTPRASSAPISNQSRGRRSSAIGATILFGEGTVDSGGGSVALRAPASLIIPSAFPPLGTPNGPSRPRMTNIGDCEPIPAQPNLKSSQPTGRKLSIRPKQTGESRLNAISPMIKMIQGVPSAEETNERLVVEGSLFSGTLTDDSSGKRADTKAPSPVTHSDPDETSGLVGLGEDGRVIRGVKDLHWLHEQQKSASAQSPHVIDANTNDDGRALASSSRNNASTARASLDPFLSQGGHQAAAVGVSGRGGRGGAGGARSGLGALKYSSNRVGL